MADYIYLIQNRLAPAQWRALDAVREAARAQGMPVFLVGGAVRDLSSGSPVRDLDFAVQGDAHALRADLEGRGAIVAGENKTLTSLYLTFPGGIRVEVGPSLSVSWPKPGQPEVQTASILDDLRRRDFTANAMAVSLNEGSYGLLLDPLNGMADLENRELRLVSPYGFIEQPALLLRAARLGERLGWILEERTRTRYENSKEEGHIQTLSEQDRGYEIEEILHEEDPLAVLEHMAAEGFSPSLFPALKPEGADRNGLDHVRDLLGQLEAQGLHPDPSAVIFPYLTAKMKEEDRQALKKVLPRAGFVRQIEGLDARSKELSSELTSKAAAQPSDSWKLLMAADPEVVLHLAVHSRSGAAQNKIKAFLKDWPQMRQRIPYAVMQEMRITPDLPVYDQLLDDLFFALMDGKLDTPEATRAFLEPYSPPAPPQIQVRRRPAKATRGRSKKAVAAAETALDTETDSDSGSTAEPEAAESKASKEAPASGSAAPATALKRESKESGAKSTVQAPPAKAPVPAKKAAAASREPKATDEAPRPSASTSAKHASKPAATKQPVKVSVAPVKATAKAVSVKVQPPKATSKTAPAKVVAVKSVSKAPAKVATSPAKKPAAKLPGKTAKVTAKKVPAKKTAPVATKVPAKKVAPPASTKATPKKAAKKAAAKGRR